MPGLNHQIIYRENENLINEEWRKVKYNPLSINGIDIAEEDYFEIHDDIIRYFFDFFYWIEMHNPAKNEQTNGFCNWGVTAIKKENISKLRKILNALIDLFENAPKNITLTGDYTSFVEDIVDGRQILSNGHYEKIKIKKEKILEKLIKFRILIEKVIKNSGYILHCGI